MMITAPGSGTVSWMSHILRPGQPPPPGRLEWPLLTRPRLTQALDRRGSPPRPLASCCSPPCLISLQFQASMALIIIIKAQHFTTSVGLHHFCLIQTHLQMLTFSHLVGAVTLGEAGEASGEIGEDLVTGAAEAQRTGSLRDSPGLLVISFPAPLVMTVIEGA